MKILNKLSSRKFWMALAAFVVGALTLFKVDANTTTQISGLIMSLGAVIAYIVGEGLVDSASVGASTAINRNTAITAADVSEKKLQNGGKIVDDNAVVSET